VLGFFFAFLASLVLGWSRWFFVESKSFELVCEEGVSVLRVYERSRHFVRLVSLGKVSVSWLPDTMTTLL